jgi:hypothetical protein
LCRIKPSIQAKDRGFNGIKIIRAPSEISAGDALLVNIGATVLSAALGGLVFALLRDFAWRWYTRPKFYLADSASASFETDDNGDITHRVFRVPIENTGRTAAGNCKPELRMEGTLDGDFYEVNQQLTWAEGNNPQRINLNANERAEFDLMRVSSEEPDGYIEVEPTLFVELPGNEQWGGDDSITIWEQEDGRAVSASVPARIDRSDFTQISWEVAQIVVTSENAEKEEGELTFQFGTDKGMVGLNIEIR